MLFKHPELLYALFFLLIPILVHLFQLRKFQKTAFTNVKFLKEISLQTRKSSQLKKWLVLLSRLFALACIIIAFAQPYFLSKTKTSKKEVVIYIDNSFSMQAKSSQGELLKKATQELFENSSLPENFSWFTNNQNTNNSSPESFKNQILKLNYSAKQLTADEVLLKANTFFSNQPETEKSLLWISDFQSLQPLPENISEDYTINTIQLKSDELDNFSIDSLYISSVDTNLIELTAIIKNHGKDVTGFPVSLYQEEELVAKTSINIASVSAEKAIFEINTGQDFQGRINITDQSMLFDNDLYFNINKPDKIKVLSVQEKSSSYLQKIYPTSEFDFKSFTLSTLDYNLLLDQHTIILNELESIPNSLQTILKEFSQNGGVIVIIPSQQADIESYNLFLNTLNFSGIEKNNLQEKQVTNIQFSHPLYQNVFENQITNFQYPKVNSSFSLLRNQTAVLSFQDGSPFLAENANTYFFLSALNLENSNFINSPLVVPTFYRIAKQSLPLPHLYYTIGNQNTYAVAVSLPQDHILTIKNDETQFIPLQQNTTNKVLITTTDEPETAGIFSVSDNNNPIQQVSYNYNRKESAPQYHDLTLWKNTENHQSIAHFFNEMKEEGKASNLWKWFVIFALLFLMIEMFLLKLIK